MANNPTPTAPKSDLQTKIDGAVQILQFIGGITPIPFVGMAVTGLTALGPLVSEAVAYWQGAGLLTVQDVLEYHGAKIMSRNVMKDTALDDQSAKT